MKIRIAHRFASCLLLVAFVNTVLICRGVPQWAPQLTNQNSKSGAPKEGHPYKLGQSNSKESVVEVPFDFVSNEIIVQVKVNGKGPFNMMLDTGTDPSAIDLTTARELGLKLNAVGKQGTGGGTGVNLAYATRMSFVEV